MAAVGPYTLTVDEAIARLQTEAKLAPDTLNPPGVIKAQPAAASSSAAAAAAAPAKGGKAPAPAATPAAKGGKGGPTESAPASTAVPDTADLPHFPPLRALPIPQALLELAQQAQAAAAQAQAQAAAAAGGKKPAAGKGAPVEAAPAANLSLPPLPAVHAAAGFTQADLEQAALAAQAANPPAQATTTAAGSGTVTPVGAGASAALKPSAALAAFPAFLGLGNTTLTVLDVSRNLSFGSKGVLKLSNRLLTAVRGVDATGTEEEGGGSDSSQQVPALPSDFQADSPRNAQIQTLLASRCERLPCTGRLGEFASVHAQALGQKNLKPQGEAMAAADSLAEEQERQRLKALHDQQRKKLAQGGEDGGDGADADEAEAVEDEDEEQRELKALQIAKIREMERAAVERDLPVVIDQLARTCGISVYT
jgi:hypothetical protein